jgi:hypothetical protein
MMKNKLILLIAGAMLFSCNNLDLNPLSEGSSETWYTNVDELEMAVLELYNIDYWDAELTRVNKNATSDGYSQQWTDKYSDNWTARTGLSEIDGATISSQTSFVNMTWQYAYKCIAAANRILINLEKAKDAVSEEKLKVFEANARFARAAQYAKLIFLYGDVPYYTTILDIDEAFALSRTSKETILDAVYEDFDFAIQNLPETYGADEYNYGTKGAALAMKARTALYMGDYALARDAAKACMDLGIYSLYPNYHELFLSSTKNSIETVFGTPRSVELGIVIPGSGRVKEPLPRIVGGFANGGPSWDLLCSYLCTDGLPIDESPLFNPHEPFKNRDPRCTATIVEFGTPWLGFIYQPHPDTLRVMNLNSGQLVSNTDNRAVGQYASYNGLVWKKKIDEDWLDIQTDPDNIVIRYADVLLIYAEARIELGEVDQSVLDAMNTVRARAYGSGVNETSLYPALTTLDQAQLRKILRVERRMEFAFEGTRYHDLIRWELAEKALNNHPIYGMLDPADLRTKLISNGLWFFPSTPQIDDDGLVDFSEMFNAGQIKLLAERTFDVSKQYFWPIPSSEIEINPNMDQNTGY